MIAEAALALVALVGGGDVEPREAEGIVALAVVVGGEDPFPLPEPEPVPLVDQPAEPPAAQPAPEPEPEPEPAPQPRSSAGIPEHWQRLADCESGDWLSATEFAWGSARWDWAKPGRPVPFGTTIHHGGLQFHPDTWTAYKRPGDPQFAYDASPSAQVAVGERVQAAQGWSAWPTCGPKVGLR